MKNKRLITSQFNTKSKNYDNHYKYAINSYSIEKNNRLTLTTNILQKINSSYEIELLDYGCGTGILAEKLDDMNNQLKYTGFDISHNMIEVCNEKFINHKNLLFYYNEKKLTKYNIIVSLGVIGYQINQLTFFNELFSYFSDNDSKYLIVTVGNQSIYRILRDNIKKFLNPNKAVYSYTPNKLLTEILNLNKGEILESYYLLPIIKILPGINKSSLFSFLYLTKYLVIKFH